MLNPVNLANNLCIYGFKCHISRTYSLGHALSESKSLIYVTIFRRKDKGVSNYMMIE